MERVRDRAPAIQRSRRQQLTANLGDQGRALGNAVAVELGEALDAPGIIRSGDADRHLWIGVGFVGSGDARAPEMLRLANTVGGEGVCDVEAQYRMHARLLGKVW